jgi:hypothetical protein
MKRQPSILYLIAAFVLVTGLPYIVAYISAGENFVFGGFLLNPIDGNSYLAKMYLGWSGDWQFTLPFTAEKGDGSFLYLFYLFLGHVSRWIGVPLIVVFHIARSAGAAYLFFMLLSFSNRIFINNEDDRIKAVLLAGFGSGVGWLAIPAGHFTSDFWVAEAYPFLSAYATPHFAVGLGLVLNLLIISMLPPSKKSILSLFILSFLLAVIQPFGVVVAGLVIGMTIFWNGWRARKWDWQIPVPVLVGGGLPLLYQYWIIMTDPQLSLWNAQNLTPAPAWWDLLLSMSPAILLALFVVIKKIRGEDLQEKRLLILWLAASLVLIFFPFNLQRRFMLGMYVPIAFLAVWALSSLHKPRLGRLWPLLFGLSILTNVIILSAGIFGTTAKDPALYLTKGEYKALLWIQAETPQEAVILASPEMGRFIPAHTGRRVLYGHPFETINAKEQEQRILAAFTENQQDFMGIDYIFYGPRERHLGDLSDASGITPVYENQEVIIFKVEGP